MRYPLPVYQALRKLRPAPLAALAKRVLRAERIIHGNALGAFSVDPSSHVGIRLLSDGEYEPALTSTVQNLVPRGGTFIDVGANEGFFTVVGARAAGVRGRVFAAEPQKRLIPLIEENLRLNAIENVSLLQVAISNSSGASEIFLTPDFNTGSSGFTKLTKYPLRRQPVSTVTLDDLFQQCDLEKVDLLKIDIEGHEYEAITGAQSVLQMQKIRHIALELHEPILVKRGRSADDILELLRDCGYRQNPDFENLVFTIK